MPDREPSRGGGARKKARIAALKALYAIDVGRGEEEQVLADTLKEAKLPNEAAVFASGLVRGVHERLSELDEGIGELAQGYEIKRLAAVDRSILRVSAYELAHVPDTPVAVVINEAVEMAKKFSTAESGAFVNGILAAYARKVR